MKKYVYLWVLVIVNTFVFAKDTVKDTVNVFYGKEISAIQAADVVRSFERHGVVVNYSDSTDSNFHLFAWSHTKNGEIHFVFSNLGNKRSELTLPEERACEWIYTFSKIREEWNK